jgi:hypothetical protein
MPHIKRVVTTIIIVALSINGCSVFNSAAKLEYFFASQSGHPTLDQGAGGGNPFASAFIELLQQKNLDFQTLRLKIVDITSEKSEGFQRPEVISDRPANWQLVPSSANEKRIALVLVYSDYKAAEIKALPGAKNDMLRITQALRNIGFEVQTVLDPDNEELHQRVKSFATNSKQADVALLYTTGHGVEVDGIIYLLPGDYPAYKNELALDAKAVKISWLGSALHARKRNLLFYAGCRNNPFSNQISQ